VRICLISREYPPETGWGGIATYTYQHAHGLKELGHDVEVVALLAPGASRSDIPPVVEDGVTVHRVSGEPLTGLDMIRSSTPFSHYVLNAVFALSKKFHEIHERNPFDVAESPEHLAEGLCPALIRSVPLVLRLHTPQSKLIAEGFHNLKPTFDQQFVAMLERLAILNADAITSPSRDMAAYVSSDVGVPLEQIQIISNPVDDKKFCPKGSRALLDDGRLYVLSIGRLEPRKGIQHLIEAIPHIVKEFQRVKFVIIGGDTNNAGGQKSMREQLLARVSQLGCLDHVTFIPHVELDAIPAYYRSADVFVLPSLYDNAPMSCLEAMASGNAVVVTDAGGTKEYAIDGECGIVIPSADPSSLARAVVGLLKDEQRRASLGKNARARVEKELTRTIIASQTVELYEEAILKHRSRAAHALYRRGDKNFTLDAEALLNSYQRMLYDFLYQQSLVFRFKHRVRKLLARIYGAKT
jgi:glycogen(starch) synthase